MALYLATPFADPDRLATAIKAAFGEYDRYLLKSGGWLIRFDGTTRELSNKIGTTTSEPPTTGSVLYVAVGGYYGRGPTDMWEWMKSRME
ncbi:hypothetical protein [Collimonas antrihumi]|uniref:hypothetical protein n=1 Tax=Collimonas antrihumi TaxID=1940615 RepID=UPI001B8B7DDD|nr:hypothetical protein [Collimonas antrihumi]